MNVALPINHYRVEPRLLLIETALRLGGSIDGRLLRATLIDASYCLDAPSELPCGGCFWVDVDDDGFPDQLTVAREPSHAALKDGAE